MIRSTLYVAVAVALTLVGLGTFAATASTPVGPPWISVEMPANPLDPQTRDAAFVVHAYHHARDASFPLTGTVEGLVDGQRRSVELELTPTARPGVFAVRKNWPSQGDWIVVVEVEGRGEASLIMELGPDGGIGEGRYFDRPASTVSMRSVRVVRGSVDASQLEDRLRTLAQATD